MQKPNRTQQISKIEGELARMNKLIHATFCEPRTDRERDKMVDGIDALQSKICVMIEQIPSLQDELRAGLRVARQRLVA